MAKPCRDRPTSNLNDITLQPKHGMFRSSFLFLLLSSPTLPNFPAGLRRQSGRDLLCTAQPPVAKPDRGLRHGVTAITATERPVLVRFPHVGSPPLTPDESPRAGMGRAA